MEKGLRIEIPWILQRPQSFHDRPKMPEIVFGILSILIFVDIFWSSLFEFV